MIYKIDAEFCYFQGSAIRDSGVFTVSVKKWYGWKRVKSFTSLEEAKSYAANLRE